MGNDASKPLCLSCGERCDVDAVATHKCLQCAYCGEKVVLQDAVWCPQRVPETAHKLVLVGAIGHGGKSSFIKRAARRTFSEHCRATIGADFETCTVTLNDAFGSVPVRAHVQLWDVSSGPCQAQFAPDYHMYLRGASAVIVCCDVTEPKTHERMSRWVDEARRHVPDAAVVLIGNKADLPHDAASFAQWADGFVARHNLLGWFPTSAKTALNVERVLDCVLRSVLRKELELLQSGSSFAALREEVNKEARQVVLLLLMVRKHRSQQPACPFSWLPKDVGELSYRSFFNC
jgi:small GTP-binding protein